MTGRHRLRPPEVDGRFAGIALLALNALGLSGVAVAADHYSTLNASVPVATSTDVPLASVPHTAAPRVCRCKGREPMEAPDRD